LPALALALALALAFAQRQRLTLPSASVAAVEEGEQRRLTSFSHDAKMAILIAMSEVLPVTKNYSIAEARNNLASIVHEVENSCAVEITRRGQAVAVLLSKQEYDRLQSGRRGFWKAYQDFCTSVSLSELNIDPSAVWRNVRDKSAGREVDL
jgi:cellobiose PTS system EIIB component